ncbi:cupin domain-containing protein [Segetibacter koreensis]|uniref:cupin domain-containing protein n=1 Tax=Segetibacter koreensis TaxID=398037 RepID=UPI0004766D3C|nr:cupin domain-containing protein [Segetibacter koreensis]
MKETSEYIRSGIIEAYVLGVATPVEAKEVEEMAAGNAEVLAAIDEFSQMIEQEALSNAITPDPIIKPMFLATINYIDRMEKGETMSFPPMLQKESKIADYKEWLSRPDMIMPPDTEDVHARIICYTPEVTTAIVWIKDMAPSEVHTNEIEKFLIVEGTCEIIIEKDIHSLKAGDFLEIPLYKSHYVKVTSGIPCKVILQRVAA